MLILQFAILLAKLKSSSFVYKVRHFSFLKYAFELKSFEVSFSFLKNLIAFELQHANLLVFGELI